MAEKAGVCHQMIPQPTIFKNRPSLKFLDSSNNFFKVIGESVKRYGKGLLYGSLMLGALALVLTHGVINKAKALPTEGFVHKRIGGQPGSLEIVTERFKYGFPDYWNLFLIVCII